MDTKDRDYDVGYCKPPQHSRWRKGESGNPQGRRGKSKFSSPKWSFNPYLETLLNEMERYMPLKEGGELIELPAIAAVHRAILLKAIKGDSGSQKLAVEIHREAHRERIKEMAQMVAQVEQYRKQWPKMALSAQRAGEPMPLPHPNHVSICVETGLIKVVGPIDDQQQAAWNVIKQDLRLFEQWLSDANLAAAEEPDSEEKQERVQWLRSKMRTYERRFVPAGWDWREILPSVFSAEPQE